MPCVEVAAGQRSLLRRAGVSRADGFTLIELFFVCAIAAIATAAAVPSFREYAFNARRAENVNGLLHALHAARGAAIKRGEAIVLCKSDSGTQCTPQAASWSAGWIVFANRDRDSPPTVDAEEPILLRHPGADGLSIRANRDALVYWPFSLGGTATSFIFCDARGSPAARAIVVSQTGRPRVSERDASGRILQCP